MINYGAIPLEDIKYSEPSVYCKSIILSSLRFNFLLCYVL